MPLLHASTRGDEYRRPIYSAASTVHQGTGYGQAPAGRAATRAQRIPTFAGYGAARQATYTGGPTDVSESVLRTYECTPSQGAVLNATLNEQYGSENGVRIVLDGRGTQLLVTAPEAIQQQVAEQIETAAAVIAGTAPRPIPTQSQTAAPILDPQNVERREYQLRNLTAERLQLILQTALGNRWTQISQPAGSPPAYLLEVAGQAGFTIWLDHGQNRLLLQGPAGVSYRSCTRLIESLDTPRATDARSRCLVSLTSLKAKDLSEVVNAIHTTNGPVSTRTGVIGPTDIQLAQAEAPAQTPAQTPAGPPAGPAPTDEDEEVTATVPLRQGAEGAEEGTGLIGPVQIEVLDGLDMIVIRGNKRDVAQVVKLIQEIEDTSTVTEPAIVVHQLTHVNCEAISELVTSLYSEMYSTRQGTVSITALVKPNALLLVGRPESVDTVVNLVKTLDQPVPPESQFRVFRLRHAIASTAQTTIEEFFQDSEGDQLAALGARVHVIADVRSNSLIVRASPRDMLELARMIAEIDTRDATAENLLRVFKLKNSLAEDLEPILQNAIAGQTTGGNQQNAEEKSVGLRFVTIDAAGQKTLSSGILTGVRVTADPRANALLISAPAESMPLIEALINQLDQLPVAEAELKVFTITNGDAAALVDMLEALFGQTTTNQSEPPVRTGASEGDSSLVSLRFATDVRTNSIIASGSMGDLAVVEAILLRLDESDVRERRTKVYRLKNVSVEAVADAINEYLDQDQQLPNIGEGLFSTPELLDREVIVVPEIISNSLIVSATPKYYDEITALVEELDKQDPMVMIQVVIAEVALNDTEEFGIEMGLQDSILFDRSLLGNISTITNSQDLSTPAGIVTTTEQIITSATNEPGFLFNDLTSPLGNSGASSAVTNANVVGGQGLSNFGVGRINSELGFGGLVMSASSESVSMLLRALKEDRRINILSRPQIMTLNNQGASIQVGERVPTIQASETNDAGGLTNSVDFQDVGLIVGVTPRISPDGLVVMEIDAEKSEVGPEAEGIPVSVSEGVTIRSPRIKTITASTTVSALDGQTVVLGGLITSNKTKIDRRVPWLSEIPVLGELFRYRGFTSERNELLIVLTPRIVDGEDDTEALLQTEAARMNWCLSDVLEMHEDIAIRPRDGEWADHETTTVYPDGSEADALKDVPTNPPSAPAVAPPATPGDGVQNRRFAPAAGSGGSYVSPASYESTARTSYPASGVNPAAGYRSMTPAYQSTPSYQSTGY